MSAGLRPRGPDLRGRVLGGRYRLAEVLGCGGMADVYAGVDGVLQRAVAVKVLHPEHGRTGEQRRRFRQEAVLGAGIEHAHVMPVLDFGEERGGEGEGALFLVMPRVEGVSLRTIALEGAVAWQRAVWLGMQALAGLGALHERGVIHRDVKPENFVVRRRGGTEVVVLLDLGLAKVVEGPGVLSMAPRSGAGILGTVTYVSPEQAREEELTAASDVYAAGVTLYELLTRRPPFSGTTLEVINAHVGQVPMGVREVAPEAGIPAGVEAVVMRALAKRAEERYAEAGAFRAALGEAMAEVGEVGEGEGTRGDGGTEEALAALAAWTSFEYGRARELSRRAARLNRGWGPLVMILDEVPEV